MSKHPDFLLLFHLGIDHLSLGGYKATSVVLV